jgi:hypothetical protein
VRLEQLYDPQRHLSARHRERVACTSSIGEGSTGYRAGALLVTVEFAIAALGFICAIYLLIACACRSVRECEEWLRDQHQRAAVEVEQERMEALPSPPVEMWARELTGRKTDR